MASSSILDVILIVASRWKQSKDSLEAFKSVLNLSITSKSCKNYLNDKLLIDISYRYVRDRSLFVKQKLMNFIRHDDFDKYKSMADLFVERFSKLESVRMLNSLLIYVIQHASCAFLNSYLDYFIERGLHVGCLGKFRAENPRTAIYPDFAPVKFMRAMKMVNMNGWEEKQLSLAKRLLVCLGAENKQVAKQISQIRKLDTTPMLNRLLRLNRGIEFDWYLFHEVLETLLKEDSPKHTDIAVKVTKELLQLPIEQQPWFFGNYPEQEMRSYNFPGRNFFLVTFIGSRLYYYKGTLFERPYNEVTKKKLPMYGLLNKQVVRDLNLYQFYQLLADNNLEGMKQMQSTHNFDWKAISQKLHVIFNYRASITGNQPHPLSEYLNVIAYVRHDVVDWLFELCPLQGIQFEWRRNYIPNRHFPIIQRIIEAGGKIATNLWIQYITKVMPTNINTMTTLANAWDCIKSQNGCQFVFEKYYDIYKQQKLISNTKMAVLLAWKHAAGESSGFQNLPKEMVKLIVDFIDEPPLAQVFANVLVDQYKKNKWSIYYRAESDHLKRNLWALELFASETSTFSDSLKHRVVWFITHRWTYSLFKRTKNFIFPLIEDRQLCGQKFVKFIFKYEMDEQKLQIVLNNSSVQLCTMEALKSRNKASLKFLALNSSDTDIVPTREQFTKAIKPKHNLTYEDAVKLINEIQSGQ